MCRSGRESGSRGAGVIYHVLVALAFGTGIGHGLCRVGVGVYRFTRKTPPTVLAMSGLWASGPVAYLLQEDRLTKEGFFYWAVMSAAMGLPCLLVLIWLRMREVAEGRKEWVRTGGRMGGSPVMRVGSMCDERYAANSGRLDAFERRLAAQERAIVAAFDYAGIGGQVGRPAPHLHLVAEDGEPIPS